MRPGVSRVGAFLFTSQFDGLTEATVLDAALRYADLAERHGFDDLWVSEHHFTTYGINPSALTLAAHLLGRTSLRVGTAVTLLPQQSPVFVAEQAALLDHLSDGRFDLGIGRGGPVADLLVAGRTLEHWSQGYWEAVDLLRSAWAGSVETDTDLYRFPRVTARPRPRRPVGAPLFTASTSTTSIDQAARRGVPLLLFMHETDETRRQAVDRWAEVAAAHGHPTDDPGHAFALLGQVIDDTVPLDDVVENLVGFFVRSSSEYPWLIEPPTVEDGRPNPNDPSSFRPYVEGLVATHPVGSPEECSRRLTDAVERSSIGRVLLMLEAAAQPDLVARNIARFGSEVLPAVRAVSPAVDAS